MANTVTAYIGLGGNIGDVYSNMHRALSILDAHDEISVTKISGVYKTPPWGIEDQDWFLNACAQVETALTGQELLNECLGAEKALKRVREVRWGPRTIDLDVLIYGEITIDEPDLQVPHPRMHERAFVILPMADIAPELELRGKAINKWMSILKTSDIQKTDFELIL